MGGAPSLPQILLAPNRVALITGGNTGIGYEAAKWIAMMGARVIIACRSEERAKNAIDKMQKEFDEEKSRGATGIRFKEKLDVEYMALDLASLKSVENFIETFKSKETKLHLLLCNAGISFHRQEYTEDGYELMFQVNYLGHFLLVSKLLPIMLNSGDDCRIIMVSSLAHVYASFDLGKAQGKHYTQENFKRLLYYGNSKLYQLMQMYCLNRRLKNTEVTVNCIHPGIVETEITRSYADQQMWIMLFQLSKLLRMTKSPFEGAKTLINAAVNPDFKDTRNAYYVDMRIKQANSLARNEEKQEALWKYSIDCLKEFLQPGDLEYLTNL